MPSEMQKEISRARKRPTDATKLRELMIKLRKGASASLTFGKIVQVMDALGWQIEPSIGWTPRHYEYKSSRKGESELMRPVADTIRYSREGLDALHAKLLAAEASSLPDEPSSVGETVIMDVEDIQKGSEHGDTFVFYFHWLEWIGTEGVEVQSPSGDGRVLLPDHHDIARGKILTDDPGAARDVWGALLDMGIVGDVNAFLGMEEHVPAAARTRENTGTCAACWGNYKLTNDVLVMHGYERPGYGFLKGKCFGVDYKPLEKSNQCAREYKARLASLLVDEKKNLAKLKNGEVTSFEEGWRGGRTVSKGEPGFAHLLDNAVRRSERFVEDLTNDVELYGKVISNWEERPMPKEGEPQRGPGFFLPKRGR